MCIQQFLIANKEIINMGLQFIIMVAGCLVVVGLLYHRKAVLLQRDAIQATMFSDISGRISMIQAEVPTKEASKEVCFNWNIRLFNELESFIFLFEHGYIAPDMERYYRHFIIEHIKYLPEEYPEVSKDFEDLPKMTFCNLITRRAEFHGLARG